MATNPILDNLFAEILKAEDRLRPFVVETPVLTNDDADQISGKKLFFKCENLQKTGSFKVRGALNAVLAYLEEDPTLTGVVGFSGGNHGVGLAWAAKKCGLSCKIVVPVGTASFRIELIKKQGAECLVADPGSPAQAMELCNRIAAEEGSKIISPYDDPFVIAGQGTIGMEMMRQVPDLDAILVAVSGCGLISGISVAVAGLQPAVQVCAVEPEGKNLQECLEKCQRLWPDPPQWLPTIATVLGLQPAGHLTFQFMCRYTSKKVFTVSDPEMIKAMKWTWENLKVIVEVSSAAGVAAALRDGSFGDLPFKRVGVILCGANCPIDSLLW